MRGNALSIRLIVMLLLFVLTCLGLCGCSKKEAEQKPQGENKQTGSKEPEAFSNMVNETETLIMEIGKTVKFIEIPVSAQQQGRAAGAASSSSRASSSRVSSSRVSSNRASRSKISKVSSNRANSSKISKVSSSRASSKQGQQGEGQQGQQGQQQQGQQPDRALPGAKQRPVSVKSIRSGTASNRKR
ncbi:MAG: hypothetical protein ACOX0F_03350 [Syntrophomonadaceae bacterium]